MEKEHNELDANRAAAHLPASAPESVAPTHAEGNGVASDTTVQQPPAAPSRDDSFAPSPLIEPCSHAAPFWHTPLEPNVFHETPLIVHSRLADAERIVILMESYLRKAGFEVEASDLRMRYTHWVKIPATQYEQLRHDLEPLRTEYQQQLRATESAIQQAQIEFTQAMAVAKIPMLVPTASQKRIEQLRLTEPISPLLVERALQADFASDNDVCGEHGVAPISSKENVWVTVGQWLFDLFAPLAAGLMLGVNLGVITGFIPPSALTKPDYLWAVVLVAIIGLCVEKLVGNTAYSLMASAAINSERRDAIGAVEPFPHMRSTARSLFFLVIVMLMTTAIVVVDGLGLHMLYEENMRKAQFKGIIVGAQVPMWLFFVAGAIISVPYIAYKAVKGWRELEIRQREARIAYLHWKHVDRRREEPAVQQAFAKAQAVQNLHQQREMLSAELEHIEKRLDSARTECVGSTQRFCEYWDELVAWLRKEQASHAYAPYYTPRRRGSNETLLQKLLGLFRS